MLPRYAAFSVIQLGQHGQHEVSLGESIDPEHAAWIVNRLSQVFPTGLPPPSVTLEKGMDKQFVAYCWEGNVPMLGDNKLTQNVNVGDNILGQNGLVDVQKVWTRQYEGKMVEIRASGILPFRVTPEHPILVTSRGRKRPPMWKEARNIKPSKDCLILPKIQGKISADTVGLDEFIPNRKGARLKARRTSLPLNEDTSWLFGMYVAEGCSPLAGNAKIREKYPRPNFTLSANEVELTSRIREILRILGYSTHEIRVTTQNSVRIELSSSILGRAFVKWFGQKAANKKVPDFIMLHKDERIVRAFLRGWEEGDGCVTTNNHGISHYFDGATVSPILALQLQLMYARLGKPVSLQKMVQRHDLIQGREVKVHDVYKIRYSISGQTTGRWTLSEGCGEGFMMKIKSVSQADYKGTVYDFTTSDHTLLLMNTVNHNCFPLKREIFFRSEYIPYVAPFHEFMHIYYTDVTGTATEVPSEAFAQFFGSMSLTQGEELLAFKCNDCGQSNLTMHTTGTMECLTCGALYAFEVLPAKGSSLTDSTVHGMADQYHLEYSQRNVVSASPTVPINVGDDWSNYPNPGFPNITVPGKPYGIAAPSPPAYRPFVPISQPRQYPNDYPRPSGLEGVDGLVIPPGPPTYRPFAPTSQAPAYPREFPRPSGLQIVPLPPQGDWESGPPPGGGFPPFPYPNTTGPGKVYGQTVPLAESPDYTESTFWPPGNNPGVNNVRGMYGVAYEDASGVPDASSSAPSDTSSASDASSSSSIQEQATGGYEIPWQPIIPTGGQGAYGMTDGWAYRPTDSTESGGCGCY